MTSELRAVDGVRLTHRAWPVPHPRAAVLLSHGLGEHGGRYEEIAGALASRRIAVHALDHRGHGLSGGARGHVDRFDDLVRDFEAFRAAVAPAGVPHFLFGHSMGALVAIRHMQAHPEAGWRGAILSAPLLRVALRPPRWKVALSGLLSGLLPKLPFHNAISLQALSSDPAYEAGYRADALLHQKITPRLYVEMGEAMRRAGEARLQLPLLVLAPGADTIVDPAAVLSWAAKQGAEVRRYPEFRHESLNERDRQRAVDDLLEWVEARLG